MVEIQVRCCGLTDLEAGELEFASSFKEKSGVFAKSASSQGSRLVEKARQLGNKSEEESGQPPPPLIEETKTEGKT